MASEATDRVQSEQQTKNAWADLSRRLTTLLIGVPTLWKILNHATLAGYLIIAVHLWTCFEFVQLEPPSAPSKKDQSKWTMKNVVFPVSSLLLSFLPTQSSFLLGLGLMNGLFVLQMQQQRSHHYGLGLLCLTIPFRAIHSLVARDIPCTVSLLLVVWNCDTGALVGGRLASKLLKGKRLPVPSWIQQISPAKSMEGFMGGLITGTWTALWLVPRVIQWMFLPQSTEYVMVWGEQQPYFSRLLLGMGLSTMAILGDLIESAIKRQAKTKDSGSLLPGHGGIFDRMDSVLLAVLLYQFVLETKMMVDT